MPSRPREMVKLVFHTIHLFFSHYSRIARVNIIIGLVCRVVPKDKLLDTAVEMANKIASFSQPSVAMAKETVNAAYELTLEAR